jgi:magnesium-transporting ATPase (P-type)
MSSQTEGDQASVPRQVAGNNRNWEQMGAASGLLATLLFVLGIAMAVIAASGSTSAPDVANAQNAPAFLAASLNQVRLQVLFTSLGIALFLWFLGSLWMRLKQAEGEPARGSTIALAGATAGSALVLVGLALTGTMGLTTSPAQANVVPALYVASALLVAFGGAMLSLFFFGVAKVILHTKALGRWLGVLAFIEALLCVLAFMTPFFDSGVLDAATGLLGRTAWSFGFVIWLLLASAVLTWEERARTRGERLSGKPVPAANMANETKGDNR